MLTDIAMVTAGPTTTRGFSESVQSVGFCSLLFVVWAVHAEGLIVTPNENGFGAVVTDINVSRIIEEHNIALDHLRHEVPKELRSLAINLKSELHKNRYLYFPNQNGLPWEHQLTFLQVWTYHERTIRVINIYISSIDIHFYHLQSAIWKSI